MTGNSVKKISGAKAKFFSSPAAVSAAAITALLVLTALFCELHGLIALHSGTIPCWERIYAAPYSAPGEGTFLGTDYQGRSVLFRALAGTIPALKVGLVAGVISVFTGTALGICAGFFRGKVDDITVWIYSTFASMPTLLFILSFALLSVSSPGLRGFLEKAGAVLRIDPGALAVYLAIGMTGWVGLCRVIRAETLKLRSLAYVNAARIAGVNSLVIIWRHILPNVRHLTIIYFTLNFGSAVMLEVLVGYLGLGGNNSIPGWGSMIAAGQERLWRGVWWELGAAGFLMFIMILALNLLGDSLRDALDPRSS
ncbi:MAG: ABC transporter permease [Lentisphaeria bacterium]|nr:ABC transporter permease [Lentisphaeria bacterium]